MARWEERKLGDCALRIAALEGPSEKLANEWCSSKKFDLPNPANWNKGDIGSQNFYPTKAAVAGDWGKLAAVAQAWREDGWFGREFGSEKYTPAVINAFALGWRELRDSNSGEARLIRWALRVSWALFSLCHHPATVKNAVVGFGGNESKLQGQSPYRQGIRGGTVLLVGDRQNAARAYQKPISAMYNYASVPAHRRAFPKYGSTNFEMPIAPPEDNGKVTLQGLGSLPRVVEAKNWAPPWESYVETFVAILNRGYAPYSGPFHSPDLHCPKGEEVSILRDEGFFLNERYGEFSVRRSPLGELCVSVEHSANGNGPSLPFAVLKENGSLYEVSPVPMQRAGSPNHQVEIGEDFIKATSLTVSVRHPLEVQGISVSLESSGWIAERVPEDATTPEGGPVPQPKPERRRGGFLGRLLGCLRGRR